MKHEEEMPQDVQQTAEEAPQEPQVAEFQKETPSVKITSYHHPHHLARQ